MEGGCRKIALSPASELALPNDNSKHDCTGGKFKLLPRYLTDREENFKEENPCNTVTERHLNFYW